MVRRSLGARIGILGGTFDPPHIGHLIIAEQARQQLGLDKVLFIPAYVPPHKKNRATANPQQRLAMVRRAIAGSRYFAATPLEIRRRGISYTVDTLKELRCTYVRAKLFLIVGGDNFAGFRTWKSVHEILKLSSIVVYNRHTLETSTPRVRARKVFFLRGAALNISSTMIRDRVRHNESIRYLVPERVEKFIRQNEMYKPTKK